MTPEIAKKLLPLVNVKRNLDALEMYMESRITDMHRNMEQGDDMKAMYQAQGAIQELRRLRTLRDEVISKAAA
ncbi:MAG: hypothetical protein CBD88_08035 [Flavobacteriales bacterium TMED228]|jgi:hypothetical protein|nr:MAG: hypothetical protein CBD88_08035 [Flavobacteriales bacterium TMED228]|tara:strand:+ start:46 stop:264 length:219 start_codon:yes stop_codon:yes gene_type:complete